MSTSVPIQPTPRQAAQPCVDDRFDCEPAPVPSRRSLTLIAVVAILASLAAMAVLLGPELFAL
jgi:hypothetical protein